nr:IS200/IS605 family transposase [Ferrimicrobium acidiphilum]
MHVSPRWIPDPNIRRGRSQVSNLHVHLVFVTKYRRGALTKPILARCRQVMSETCEDSGATLTEFNGEEDHVPLLVEYPPTVQISILVNSLKGVSARILRKEFPRHISKFLCKGHLWSPSYFAGSCGGAPLSVISDYIARQKIPQ